MHSKATYQIIKNNNSIIELANWSKGDKLIVIPNKLRVQSEPLSTQQSGTCRMAVFSSVFWINNIKFEKGKNQQAFHPHKPNGLGRIYLIITGPVCVLDNVFVGQINNQMHNTTLVPSGRLTLKNWVQLSQEKETQKRRIRLRQNEPAVVMGGKLQL